MKRVFSQSIVIIYWVGLVVCVLSVIGVTTALATGSRFFRDGVPVLPVIVIIYLLPVLIGWRIWVHRRAQKTAAMAEVFDTEQEDG